MRIGITGCAGYVGSSLLHHLLASQRFHKHTVVGVDALLHGGDALLSVIDHPRFTFVWGRLTPKYGTMIGRKPLPQVNDWSPLMDCDVIIHAAGLVGEPVCSADPDRAVRFNLDPLRELVDSIRMGCRLPFIVNISTCSVYGPTTYPVEEEWQPSATGVYASTKIKAERIVNRNNLGVNLRLGTLFGMSPRMRFDLLINQAARIAALNYHSEVDGDQPFFRRPAEWRPYLAMRDLHRAIEGVLMWQWESIRGRTFNIISANLQQRDLATMLVGKVSIADDGKPVGLTGAAFGKLGELLPPSGYQCSNSAAREEFDFFSPIINTAEEIQLMLRAIPIMRDPWSEQWRNVP